MKRAALRARGPSRFGVDAADATRAQRLRRPPLRCGPLGARARMPPPRTP